MLSDSAEKNRKLFNLVEYNMGSSVLSSFTAQTSQGSGTDNVTGVFTDYMNNNHFSCV